MKKRMLKIFLCGVLILGITGCGGSSYSNFESTQTIEDKIKDQAKGIAIRHTNLVYSVSYVNAKVTTIKQSSNNVYTVYGKINAKDNYGDNYSGTFDGNCTVNEDEKINCDLDYSKMLKDR